MEGLLGYTGLNMGHLNILLNPHEHYVNPWKPLPMKVPPEKSLLIQGLLTIWKTCPQFS
jgi:hypothetical protein